MSGNTARLCLATDRFVTEPDNLKLDTNHRTTSRAHEHYERFEHLRMLLRSILSEEATVRKQLDALFIKQEQEVETAVQNALLHLAFVKDERENMRKVIQQESCEIASTSSIDDPNVIKVKPQPSAASLGRGTTAATQVGPDTRSTNFGSTSAKNLVHEPFSGEADLPSKSPAWCIGDSPPPNLTKPKYSFLDPTAPPPRSPARSTHDLDDEEPPRSPARSTRSLLHDDPPRSPARSTYRWYDEGPPRSPARSARGLSDEPPRSPARSIRDFNPPYSPTRSVGELPEPPRSPARSICGFDPPRSPACSVSGLEDYPPRSPARSTRGFDADVPPPSPLPSDNDKKVGLYLTCEERDELVRWVGLKSKKFTKTSQAPSFLLSLAERAASNQWKGLFSSNLSMH
ncbi:hypothetical protein M408DRAFT_31196 [Serendipita vermifera MAFF 305830]|uniref:Uncharacterized protein n=1 Tax=Serendipita vermifera MAFF 305830 TaxID=933852 RepID=A0A0C2WP73_SERVB|nr:hypothetical protein M408DRAFT_31196 [Serendipita vermifera MAFF 305830]